MSWKTNVSKHKTTYFYYLWFHYFSFRLFYTCSYAGQFRKNLKNAQHRKLETKEE